MVEVTIDEDAILLTACPYYGNYLYRGNLNRFLHKHSVFLHLEFTGQARTVAERLVFRLFGLSWDAGPHGFIGLFNSQLR